MRLQEGVVVTRQELYTVCGGVAEKGGGHALGAVGFVAGSGSVFGMLTCAVVGALRELTRAVGLRHQRLLVDLVQELAVHVPAQVLQPGTAGTAGRTISVGVPRQPVSQQSSSHDAAA
jgi:hypothetical protein